MRYPLIGPAKNTPLGRRDMEILCLLSQYTDDAHPATGFPIAIKPEFRWFGRQFIVMIVPAQAECFMDCLGEQIKEYQKVNEQKYISFFSHIGPEQGRTASKYDCKSRYGRTFFAAWSNWYFLGSGEDMK